jgi:endoglucanase
MRTHACYSSVGLLLVGLGLLGSGCGGSNPTAVSAADLPKVMGKMGEGAGAPKGGNLLKNSDFEEGVLTPWITIFNPPGKGSAKVDAGQACLTIESGGKGTYDVLLRQRPLMMKRHQPYQIYFKARATSPIKLMPKIMSVGSPQVEMWSAIVDVTTEARGFSAPFKWTEELGSDVELVIHMGGPLTGAVPATVCLDDLAIVDPSAPGDVAVGPAIPKVRVNQVGYIPRLPKYAGYKSTSPTPLEWQLLDSAGKVAKSGQTKVFGEDKDAGELVHQIDFSDFKQPGQGFVLAVGNDKSDPFAIGTDLYKKLKYDSLEFYYHQRSGIDIAMPYAGNQQWARPAGHLGDRKTPCAPGSGCNYSLDVAGGWYDAGDHGKYVVNGGITVWTLLNWYERTKAFGSSLSDYADGKLQIPENKNGKNDLLDEVRWELEFLMKMQVPDGERLAGMAHHKMHNEKWSGIPTRPEEDKIPRFLKPPSTGATLNLAAVAAQCARVYKDVDTAFANKCLVSAEKAWAAAEKNPKVYAPGDDFKSGGGAYGDVDVTDERYWAAAELYVTTGKPEYLKAAQQYKQHLQVATNAGGGLSAMAWANVASLGTISMAVAPSQLPKAEVARARDAVVAAAQKFMAVIGKNGYRVPFEGHYPWGSNSFVANNGVVFGLAYDFTKKEAFLAAAAESLDYLLGRNAMAKSYITGYGTRPLQNPHHRFWAHQENEKFPPPPPGILSGGPNSKPDDPTAIAMGLTGCAAQKCFIDHIQSWTTNEIAINWNAPLVWLSGFVDEKAAKP